jgi:hypothetical protein
MRLASKVALITGGVAAWAARLRPRAKDIVGVITKRAIADTVIDSFED